MQKIDSPTFFEMLSTEDQKLYRNLKNEVDSSSPRYQRNQASTFDKLLQMIRDYCEHSDSDAWKRYLVCGICWFEDYMAINIRNLKQLLSKSKSSINSLIASLDYKALTIKGGEAETLLFAKIPMLWGNYSEFRKWSIRKKKESKINGISNETDEFFDDLFKDIEWDDDCCDKKEETKDDIIDLDINTDNFDFDFGSFSNESCTMMF